MHSDEQLAMKRDERGVVIILVALALIGILLLMAIAIDVPNARQERRQAQNAADAAALAAASKLPDRDAGIAAAKHYALRNFGVPASAWPGCVGDTPLDDTPDSGNTCISFNTANTRVRVTVPTKGVSTYFGGFAGVSDIAVKASATAQKTTGGGGASGPAILVLNPNDDFAFSMSAGAIITVSAAGVVVNSRQDQAMVAAGGSSLTVASPGIVQVVGPTSADDGCKNGCAIFPSTPTPTDYSPNTGYPDPYASLPAPSTTCAPADTHPQEAYSSQSVTLSPGCWTGRLTFGPSATVTLRPGVYVLNDLRVDTSSVTVSGPADAVTGNGVLIYNLAGGIITSGSDVDLTPPDTGTYQGVAYFQARASDDDFTISGSNPQVNVNGGVWYMPGTGSASTSIKPTLTFSSSGGSFAAGIVVQGISVAGTVTLSGTTPCQIVAGFTCVGGTTTGVALVD